MMTLAPTTPTEALQAQGEEATDRDCRKSRVSMGIPYQRRRWHFALTFPATLSQPLSSECIGWGEGGMVTT